MKKNKKYKKINESLAEKQTKQIVGGTRQIRTRVIGIGGGGGLIVSQIFQELSFSLTGINKTNSTAIISKFQHQNKGKKVAGVIRQETGTIDFVAVNTDLQALESVDSACRVFQFGQDITRGLGCGMDVNLAETCARNEKERIVELLKDVDLCILVVSLGGGVGSGATSVFAEVCREQKIFTLGLFALPFGFEGERKIQIANETLEKLVPNLNARIVIPNEKIFQIINTKDISKGLQKVSLREALLTMNKILARNLEGFIEMLYLPGLINIDFADLKTILEGKGRLAYLHSEEGQGSDRAASCLEKVLSSPLNEYNIQGAERILFNISASADLKMREVGQISKGISEFNKKAKIIFGISQNNKYGDKIKITLLAIGCGTTNFESLNKVKKESRLLLKKQKKEKKEKKEQPGIVSEKEKDSFDLNPSCKREKKQEKRKGTEKNPKKKKQSENKQKEKLKINFKQIKKEKFDSGLRPKKEIPVSRRNALELKKVTEDEEEKNWNQEKKWDIPAFIRRATK